MERSTPNYSERNSIYDKSTLKTKEPSELSVKKPFTATTQFIIADPEKVKLILSTFDDVHRGLAKALLSSHKNDLVKVENALKEVGYKKKQPSVDNKPSSQTSTRKLITATIGVVADIEKEKIILASYDISKELVRSMLRIHNNNVEKVEKALNELGYKKGVFAVQSLVRSLKAEFPFASVNGIKKRLVQSNNSVEEARKSLESAGYQNKATAKSIDDIKKANLQIVTKRNSPRKNVAQYGNGFAKTSAAKFVKEEQNKSRKETTFSDDISNIAPRNMNFHKDSYKSTLRIEPVGPDAAFCKGPNASLLLKTKVKACGPNRVNRKGPQRINRKGPQSR